jgi:Mlc titration factor MtfA (ptsG expression regulator)
MARMLGRLFGKASARVEIPDALWDTALRRQFLARLAPDERARLRTLAEAFLASKEMATAHDLELTAAMQVDIAAQACLPILNLGLPWYRGWTSIVIHPAEFVVPRRVTDDAGVVHEYTEAISGEAWEGGPLLLSWQDVQAETTHDQPYNVVLHEFAHKLDMLDGEADGVPPFDRTLHVRLAPDAWLGTLEDARERLVAELELIESRLPSNIDPDSSAADPYYAHLPLDAYAAQDASEFFAVSSEAFFIAPHRMRAAFPAWSDLLAAFYRQSPA